MPTVTLSSKNQISIPAEMVRGLRLKAGDKLHVIHMGDHLALFPTPANMVSSLVGSMKGFWGSREEIDRYVAEERASWGVQEADKERLEDVLATDPDAKQVLLMLREKPLGYDALGKATGLQGTPLTSALHKLKEVNAVREVELPDPPTLGDQTVYRVTDLGRS